MTRRRKPATRLPSSERVLFHPSGDEFEEQVLVDLIQEARENKVHPFQYIIITEKRRDRRLNDWGYEGAYVTSQMRVRYSQLLKIWKNLPGNMRDAPYTQENEFARNNLITTALERAAKWGPAIQAFMTVGEQEARDGIGRGACYPIGYRGS